MSRPKGSKNKSTLKKEKLANLVATVPSREELKTKKQVATGLLTKKPMQKKKPVQKKKSAKVDKVGSMTKAPKRKTPTRKPKSIFKKNGFSTIPLAHYQLIQIPKAIETRSYVIEPQGKGKTIMSFIHIIGNIFRNCKSDEYLLFVKENNEGLGVFVRTGYRAGGCKTTKKLLDKWEKAFFTKMAKDTDFVRY